MIDDFYFPESKNANVISLLNIGKPTLVLDKQRAMKNIERMANKAQRSKVRFRPHFKTHQSAQIGEWFRNFGVESITVSSVEMAGYFANHGWRDITIAFPVNIREIENINELREKIRLNLLVESKETVAFLNSHLKSKHEVWIKIDVGYYRTGIMWNQVDEIHELARQIQKSKRMVLKGILTHAGHTYHARSTAEVATIYHDSVGKMNEVRNQLPGERLADIEISIGDSPSCSIVDDFTRVDEIRPGNFVFYDIMQLSIGSCDDGDMAVALACPVVAKHRERNEIVIYGGAVHLSKEFVVDREGRKVFGYAAIPTANGWSRLIQNTYVSALSQEHGIIRTGSEFFDTIRIGDVIFILPVHSCLTANLMGEYVTIDGEIIRTM